MLSWILNWFKLASCVFILPQAGLLKTFWGVWGTCRMQTRTETNNSLVKSILWMFYLEVLKIYRLLFKARFSVKQRTLKYRTQSQMNFKGRQTSYIVRPKPLGSKGARCLWGQLPTQKAPAVDLAGTTSQSPPSEKGPASRNSWLGRTEGCQPGLLLSLVKQRAQ